MTPKKYFVNNGVGNLGPFTMLEITQKIEKRELKVSDRICIDVDQDRWISISEAMPAPTLEAVPALDALPELNMALQAAPVIVPPVAKMQPQAELPKPSKTESPKGVIKWFVLKGKDRFGPFEYETVLRMLQEKSIFEYDYVWHEGMDQWKRVAQLEQFSREAVRMIFKEGRADEQVFYRRSFPRLPFETDVICHDNNKVWRGKTKEISEGGASVVIENAMIVPGQNIYLHFKAGGIGTTAFNVLCEVVFKQYLQNIKGPEAPIYYGVKFLNISKQDRDVIRHIRAA